MNIRRVKLEDFLNYLDKKKNPSKFLFLFLKTYPETFPNFDISFWDEVDDLLNSKKLSILELEAKFNNSDSTLKNNMLETYQHYLNYKDNVVTCMSIENYSMLNLDYYNKEHKEPLPLELFNIQAIIDAAQQTDNFKVINKILNESSQNYFILFLQGVEKIKNSVN